jgi:hypothetical protein
VLQIESVWIGIKNGRGRIDETMLADTDKFPVGATALSIVSFVLHKYLLVPQAGRYIQCKLVFKTPAQ